MNTKQKAILKFKDPGFPDRVLHLLLSTGKVKIQGIGILEVRRLKSRSAFNVGAGKMMTLPARNKIVFRPEKKIKIAIQTAL